MIDREALKKAVEAFCEFQGGLEASMEAAITAYLSSSFSPTMPTGKEVAWRWRARGASEWIYNPTVEWLEQQGDAIEKQPLYTCPLPTAPGEKP